MVVDDCMLQIVGKRIEFWRDQLQAAFRSGDAERIAECTRFIEEYSVITALALSQPGAAADAPDRQEE